MSVVRGQIFAFLHEDFFVISSSINILNTISLVVLSLEDLRDVMKCTGQW